jgi:hypothetical protein
MAMVLELLKDSPTLVADFEALIDAFKGGGPGAAQQLIAGKVASDTATLEQELQTPLSFKK